MKKEQKGKVYPKVVYEAIDKWENKIKKQAQQKLWGRIKFFGYIEGGHYRGYIKLNDLQVNLIKKKFGLDQITQGEKMIDIANIGIAFCLGINLGVIVSCISFWFYYKKKGLKWE